MHTAAHRLLLTATVFLVTRTAAGAQMTPNPNTRDTACSRIDGDSCNTRDTACSRNDGDACNTPGSAAPADGYFVCSAFMTSTRKLFYTFPFAGDSSRANEFALVYAAMLRDKGYASASPYAPAGSPPPELTVDCRHNRTQKQAMEIKDRLASGAARENTTPVPTSFNPQ